MTDSSPPPRSTRLAFHGPLSEARADRIVRRLTRTGPATVLDIGCGWAELTLRILDAAPGATGVGLDICADDLARGRRNATARGLADRMEFVEESAVGTTRGPADLVLCLGASHALSDAAPPRHTTAALGELRRLVAPGGRVLLGEGFWERTPTEAELSRMWPGAHAGEHLDLAGLADAAVAAGFRPEWIETAGQDEWDEFESAYQADTEEWLATHGDHPLAAETRERLDRHRTSRLAYRGVLGLAYLTLIPVD
ncbi:cyclopropane-fatty-acyl-phospholipid synthase family protein [Streptomyces sp. XD-27]|uniref:SAM-dependent methyltransferase n=1 Tax=Streptomyces sp. XD-27 TaxID=3062779 RepID=UPI0026F43B18|nr:class I SAM-dependent methyltransferase [Streptomyces sp. XD-27]WKX73946.1 class I SAM-dependent methyltransferase [Streptomyces sp. XD-27]